VEKEYPTGQAFIRLRVRRLVVTRMHARLLGDSC
jgi:hypothetical protein